MQVLFHAGLTAHDPLLTAVRVRVAQHGDRPLSDHWTLTTDLLSAAPRTPNIFNGRFLGFRYAPPQTLCCRPLRGLKVETRAIPARLAKGESERSAHDCSKHSSDLLGPRAPSPAYEREARTMYSIQFSDNECLPCVCGRGRPRSQHFA
jgi:hypothetical protein